MRLSRFGLRRQLAILTGLCVLLVLVPLVIAFGAWQRISAGERARDEAFRMQGLVERARAAERAWLVQPGDATQQAITTTLADVHRIITGGTIAADDSVRFDASLETYRAGVGRMQTARTGEIALEEKFLGANEAVSAELAKIETAMQGLRGRLQIECEDFGMTEMGVLNLLREAQVWVNRLSAGYQRYHRPARRRHPAGQHRCGRRAQAHQHHRRAHQRPPAHHRQRGRGAVGHHARDRRRHRRGRQGRRRHRRAHRHRRRRRRAVGQRRR
jgi:hypothetical protein